MSPFYCIAVLKRSPITQNCEATLRNWKRYRAGSWL